MREYRHIQYEERVKIAQMKQSMESMSEIALALGRSKSTIFRELRRNEAPPGEYWPDTAHSKARSRQKRECRIDRNPALKDFVLTQLCCHYWTPEQIAGYLSHRQRDLPKISHETVYTWIYQKAQAKEKLWKFLPRHKAKRGLRKSNGASQSRIPNRISINDRPLEVSKKREFGHWEGDLMSFRKNSQHILVLRERKTMFTQSIPLLSKRASTTAQNLISLMKDIPPEARKTMTIDNGGEFAAHALWSQELNLPSYFCDPYASWQKGGVENTNGRLRRDLPRKTNISQLTQEDFNETIDNYNSTPRKKLNWLTPLEAFNRNLKHSVALQT
jgi:IS30 family transposase